MNATNLLNHLSIPRSLCCEPVVRDHVGRATITKMRVEVARVQCTDLGTEVHVRCDGLMAGEGWSDRKGWRWRRGRGAKEMEEKGRIEGVGWGKKIGNE